VTGCLLLLLLLADCCWWLHFAEEMSVIPAAQEG
jgi:hypothetical protein